MKEPHRGFVSTNPGIDPNTKQSYLKALSPMKKFDSAILPNGKKRYKGNVEFKWNAMKNQLSSTYTPYGSRTSDT